MHHCMLDKRLLATALMLQRLRDGSNLHERQLAHAAFPRAGLCQLIVLCSPACAAAQLVACTTLLLVSASSCAWLRFRSIVSILSKFATCTNNNCALPSNARRLTKVSPD